jgi:hypothetical protein
MLTELEVLSLVGRRLEALEIPYMLTGSVAMAYYATPRMTRDIDIVVALAAKHVGVLEKAFAADFYIDLDSVREAIVSERLFNLMHLNSAIKVDLIIRKASEYRHLEFARRKLVRFGSVETWIVSREDLILSKLVWAEDAQSELQRRDVSQLITAGCDMDYIQKWAPVLGVSELLKDLQ